MSRRAVRQTHAWGDAPFSWSAPVLAARVSGDGSLMSSVHRDGAWVEWDIASGEIARIVARVGPTQAASFVPDGETAIVVRRPSPESYGEIESIDRASGARTPKDRWTSADRILISPAGTSFACTNGSLVPLGGGSLHAIGDATVTALNEPTLALGNEGLRVVIVTIPHPGPWRFLGHDADGNPDYEPPGPSRHEVRVLDARGETLAAWPTDQPYWVRGLFRAEEPHVIVFVNDSLTSWVLDAKRERWCVPMPATHVELFEEHSRLYASADGRSLRALSFVDGATRWSSPIAACSITEDESLAIVPWGSSLALLDVKRGARRDLPAARSEIQRVVLSADTQRVMAQWQGAPRSGTGIGSTLDGTWSEPLEASDLEWRARDASRSPSARPEWAPFLGVHRAAVFEGDEVVTLGAGTLSRFRLQNGAPWYAPSRTVDGSVDNVVGALAPGRLLLIDRRTAPRRVAPAFLPEKRTLRVFDTARDPLQARELRSWSHAEAVGEPMLAISYDGRRGIDAVREQPHVRVWDLDRGGLLAWFDLEADHDAVSALDLSDDGRVIAIGTTRGRVLRFEVDET
jgi:hypothetical protein